MSLFEFSDTYKEPGTLIGRSKIVYKILSTTPHSYPPGGASNSVIKGKWRMQLVRASENEETVFLVMET